MDAINLDATADWAAVTPLIQKQQSAIAALAQDTLRPVSASARSTDNIPENLSNEEQRVVEQLRTRDREVRTHEQAHKSVGGAYASAPTYTYEVGPDGKQYAVGGQVQIDVSPIPDDPAATIAKMEVVKAAALAPAEPSTADRQVAAQADALRIQAIGNLNALRRAEQTASVDLRA